MDRHRALVNCSDVTCRSVTPNTPHLARLPARVHSFLLTHQKLTHAVLRLIGPCPTVGCGAYGMGGVQVWDRQRRGEPQRDHFVVHSQVLWHDILQVCVA